MLNVKWLATNFAVTKSTLTRKPSKIKGSERLLTTIPSLTHNHIRVLPKSNSYFEPLEKRENLKQLQRPPKFLYLPLYQKRTQCWIYNALPSHDVSMVAKMRCLLSSSNSVKDRWLKCLKKRGVTGFLPPPGGPIAETKLMSTSSRKVPKTEYRQQWDKVKLHLHNIQFILLKTLRKNSVKKSRLYRRHYPASKGTLRNDDGEGNEKFRYLMKMKKLLISSCHSNA